MNINKNVLVLLDDWKDNYLKKNIGINILSQRNRVCIYCNKKISGGNNLNIIEGRIKKSKSGIIYSLVRYINITYVLFKYNINIVNWCYTTDDELLMICIFKLFVRRDLTIFVKSDSEDITKNKSFFIRKYFYKYIDRIFVESDEMKSTYERYFEKKQVVTIFNPSMFEFYNFERRLRNKVGFNKLLFVGIVARYKNIHGLLNIFESYAKRNDDRSITLVLIPDDLEYWAEIQLRIQDLLGKGFKINVLIKAPIETIYDKYLNSDILCITSFVEGVPNVISDAFYMGIPVISYSVGNIPNILCDDDLLCTDESDFIKKLEQFCNISFYEEKRLKFLKVYDDKMSLTFFKQNLLIL
jgi:glycosyltransferase involved in cell wall biosynthesis